MYRPKDTQEAIVHRLQISLGHLEKVLQMVKDDVYCIDVLHQMQAVREALKQTEDVIMAKHLETCVGASKTAISEVMSVFNKRHG
ncbi:metal-sensing transcriptional repressor [Candidatus Microgenomates bacterium]|nr:metal-sensing transcriptional repressor [Candidatus Microgenomates bacterium]